MQNRPSPSTGASINESMRPERSPVIGRERKVFRDSLNPRAAAIDRFVAARTSEIRITTSADRRLSSGACASSSLRGSLIAQLIVATDRARISRFGRELRTWLPTRVLSLLWNEQVHGRWWSALPKRKFLLTRQLARRNKLVRLMAMLIAAARH